MNDAARLDAAPASAGEGAPRWVDALALLRERHPLVQCITNTVVQQITANALLAAGASPAMVDHPDEVGAFAAAADALLINLGTISPHQLEAMPRAARGATEAGTPWTLDPVAVGPLPVRTAMGHELAGLGPAAIRGNASEVLALAGTGEGGRGADSTAGSEEALDAARELAARTGACVAVSGAVDLVVSADRTTRVRGGDAGLTLVTGTGCSLGALVAAAVAASDADSRHDAVVAAHALAGAAGTVAAGRSTGPGSFAVAWLDALGTLTPQDVRTHVDVSDD